MVTIKFYIKNPSPPRTTDVYEFTAETPLDAMEMCNRRVIDKLDPPSYMSWAKSGPNEYTYVHGNFFD